MCPSGVASVRFSTGSGHRTDVPDASPEERALRAVEWQIVIARRAAEADRRRRLRAVEVEAADQEVRARRDGERRQHAARLELSRDRARESAERVRPAIDLAQVDLRELRIERL